MLTEYLRRFLIEIFRFCYAVFRAKPLFLFIIFLNGFIIPSLAQDIALHKTYILSANPDDPYGVSPQDRTSLTDGIFTTGVYFWSQKTTAGWARQLVTITIDLGSEQPVGTVSFSTVRFDKQNVYFPANIYVFLSNDNSNFKYVGDAADTITNQAGDYKLQKFVLSNINTEARYVRLTVIPKGTQIYTDEIQVFKSTDPRNEQLTGVLTPQNMLNDVVDSLKKLDFLQHNIERRINSIISGGLRGELSPVAKLQNMRENLHKKNLTYAQLNELESEATRELLPNLKRVAGNAPFIVTQYNPWDTLSELFIPTQNITPAYNFTLPVHGIQYGSFLITNTSNTSQEFNVNAVNSSPALMKLFVYQVPVVPTENYKEVADPILPVVRTSLRPGHTEMYFFKIEGLGNGQTRAKISIRNGDNKLLEIPVSASLVSIPGLQNLSVENAMVWSYLYYPLLKDRVPAAMSDLLSHRINTVAIPPNIVPSLTTPDHSAFLSYISKIKGMKNVLVIPNFIANRVKNYASQFMSVDWQVKFKSWYRKIIQELTDSGFAMENIYMYPFDEVYGKNIEDFHSLIIWAKENIPGIKFYATLANKDAIRSILPLVDIAQIQSNYADLQNLPPHKCQVWLYSGSAPARDLSPYSFYRLMSWQAFANQFQGVGFWNYASEGVYTKLALIDAPLIYPTASFSVIYDGPNNTIISTRRWEAFLLGIQDYDLLNLYGERFGKTKAIELAAKVFSEPNVLNLADETCDKIIEELANKH